MVVAGRDAPCIQGGVSPWFILTVTVPVIAHFTTYELAHGDGVKRHTPNLTLHNNLPLPSI